MTAPYSSSRFAYEGTETTETSIVRTGGAVDPAGQAQSRKNVTTANSQWLRPFRCEPWAIWNETTGADVTVTVYGMANHASVLNDEILMDVEYLGDASSTLGKIVSTTKTNVLATGAAVTSDASTWPTPVMTFDEPLLIGAFVPGVVALSNGNLTLTKITTGNDGIARSTYNARVGKFYMEFTLGSVGGVTTHGAGFITSRANFLTDALNGMNVAAVYVSGTTITTLYSLNASTGVGFGAGAFQNFGFAIDLDNRLIWVRKAGGLWNLNASANPVTGVGGYAISPGDLAPFIYLSPNGAGNSITANFGATAYAYTPPSGFGNWGTIWTPFKLVATLNSPQPGQPGLIHVRPKIGKPSAVIYLDPKIELSPASSGYTASAHKSSRYAYEGTETTETTIKRSGSAHSRKIVTTANAQWLRPYRAEPYAVWNDSVGEDVTVTVYGNAATLPLTDEIWAEVEYLNTTHGTIVTTTKANVLATGVSVASDASSWAGGTTAFKLVATLNSPQPGQPGLINVRVKAAKPSATYYLDPTPVLT